MYTVGRSQAAFTRETTILDFPVQFEDMAQVATVPITALPGGLPSTALPADADPASVVATVLQKFPSFSASDFAKDGFWRDFYAFSSTIRTFNGASRIAKAWATLSARLQPGAAQLEEHTAHPMALGPECAWIEASFRFAGAANGSKCVGMLSLVWEGGDWKIWCLRTILDGIDGCPDIETPPAKEAVNGANGVNGHQETVYDAVVVGAGQCGLFTGARMAALGMKYVVLEKNERVGDNWRHRYDSFKLHTPNYYSSLPFDNTFSGKEYPTYIPRDPLADGLEQWSERYSLNISTSTSLEHTTWDESAKQWITDIKKNGERSQIRSRFVIFTIGSGGQIPARPMFENESAFQGQTLHSKDFTTATSFAGKHVVVVGAANSAHDVAEDSVEAGAKSVTILQRSPALTVTGNTMTNILSTMYPEGVSMAAGDRNFATMPTAAADQMFKLVLGMFGAADAERWKQLEKAGWQFDQNSSIVEIATTKLGGHFMDMGLVDMILDGRVAVKKVPTAPTFLPNGLKLASGEEIPADVIVFATGFKVNASEWLREQVGPKGVSESLGDILGLTEEGETRNIWKPCGPPNMLIGIGDFGMARFYSRLAALHVKLHALGRALEPYTETPA